MSRSKTRKRLKPAREEPEVKYTVGYKRPPIATRFQPGGVGNPKGRPKKRKTVGQTLEETLMR